MDPSIRPSDFVLVGIRVLPLWLEVAYGDAVAAAEAPEARLALEHPSALHGAVALAHGLVELDAHPVPPSGQPLHLAHELMDALMDGKVD